MLLLQTNPSATFLLAAERQKRPNGDGDFFQWISQMALEQHIENSSFSDVLPGRKRLSWNTWKFHYQVVLLENPFMACMSSFFSKNPESERKILLDCLKITQLWHFHHFFVLLKLTCLVTLFDYFWQFWLFFSTQNVNVARFARNIEWDFFLWFSNTVSLLQWTYFCFFIFGSTLKAYFVPVPLGWWKA